MSKSEVGEMTRNDGEVYTSTGVNTPGQREEPAGKHPQERLTAKAYKFAKVFNTADGQEILNMLEAELNPVNMFSECANRSNFNLGRRDAFMYIQQMLRIAQTHGE